MNLIYRNLVAVFRGIRLALHLGYGLLLAISYPWFGLKLRRRILQRWSAGLLDVINVRVTFAAKGEIQDGHPGLVVSNHISWLDVFVLNSVIPMRFVAKSEVRAWPVIGWLCARAQTLFIERGKMRSAARINTSMAELLQQGESLAVFPEGTTTDGAQVANFHSSLLQPAIDAGAQIHPIAIRYQDSRGERSHDATYIDETSLGQSIWHILCSPQLQVRLLLTPALDVRGVDRRELATQARQQIGTALEAMQLSATMAARQYKPVQASCARAGAEQHFQSLYCVLLYTTLAYERDGRATQ
ncbi:MAG: lysophospholipid acyltransferase family protein [Sideroxydans sp.]|nr:lysophospholipid acyltransferase family protein [Sideroxydans sp.]